MKNAILLLLCIVTLCGCVSQPESAPSETDETSAVTEASPDESSAEKQYSIKQNDLGIPLIQRYAQTETAIIPWDIIVYQNSLFVGSGDLSYNSGPVDLWRYDIKAKEWINSYTAPEEEISRFCIINGVLTAPGIDAREGWEYANYYCFNGTNWVKKRTIPNSSHCFDLVSHENKLFAAIEYEADTSAYYVAVSDDNGETFKVVPLLKDGAKVKKDIWLNDVFVIAGKVCALCNRELYVYDGENFVYRTSWNDCLQSRGYRKNLIQSEAYHNGTLYFTTGNLYKCEGSFEPVKITPPDDAVVQDIYVYEDEMYLLCISRNDTEYVMTVYRFDGEFAKETEFTNDAMAVSFAVYGNKYYFGMASKNRNNKNNGRIIEIEKLC